MVSPSRNGTPPGAAELVKLMSEVISLREKVAQAELRGLSELMSLRERVAQAQLRERPLLNIIPPDKSLIGGSEK